MKRYGLIMLIIGVLVFVLAHFLDVYQVKGITFKVGDLLINLSATLISISFLALLYQLFGEEPTVNLLNTLIESQKTSKVLNDLGVEAFVCSRSEIDFQQMHEQLLRSSDVFIVARNFSAIRHRRVRDLFKTILARHNTSVHILIQCGSTSRKDLLNFYSELTAEEKQRTLLKEIDFVYCGMYGSEDLIYVSLYLSTLSGDESPLMVCTPKTKKALYNVYLQEYQTYWNKGVPIQ